MTFRKALFWVHLAAGVIAGVIILVMSVTGVLLTYERQMISWADGGVRSAQPQPGATPLPPETLLSRIEATRHAVPATLTFRAAPNASVEAGFGRDLTLFVNPYDGEVLGGGSRGIRAFFSQVTGWHRWLGAQGSSRAAARAVTGASNLLFLVLVVLGAYLWLPRVWSWRHIKPILLFRGGLAGRARDFNWHNVIGVWCVIPLVIIVASGVVMSYPWANSMLFKLSGSPLPAAQARGPEPGGEGGRGAAGSPNGEGAKKGDGRRQPGSDRERQAGMDAEARFQGLSALLLTAERQVPEWQSITLRVPPSAGAPVSFSIDQSSGGRPDKAAQLTLDRRTGAVTRWETFASQNLGRRLRSLVRFGHTGEAAGVAGQTVAGIASAGGAVLVWTGLALTWRRFRSWQTRRKSRQQEAVLV